MSVDADLRDNGLLIITFNEPKYRNPMGHAGRQELLVHLTDAENNPDVRAVVLTGADGNFSAGGDIRDQKERSISQHRERFALARDVVMRLARFSKPVVAAVEGWAAGAGLGLALACPTIVASREARFVTAFTKIGLIPDMGLFATLPVRIGAPLSRRLLLSNRVVEGPEALDVGLVDELADAGDAVRLAGEIALVEADCAPLARQSIIDWFARDIGEALEYEQSVQPGLLNSADAAEGRAAFAEKRAPKFSGR